MRITVRALPSFLCCRVVRMLLGITVYLPAGEGFRTAGAFGASIHDATGR
jgi:hypothetical protein